MEHTPRFVADAHLMLVSIDVRSYTERAAHTRRDQIALLLRTLHEAFRDAGLREPTDAWPDHDVLASSRQPAKRNAASLDPRLSWGDKAIAIVGLGGLCNPSPWSGRRHSGVGDEGNLLPPAVRQLLSVAQLRPYPGVPLGRRSAATAAVEIVAAAVGQGHGGDDWNCRLTTRFPGAPTADTVRTRTTGNSGPQPPSHPHAVVTNTDAYRCAETPYAAHGAGWWASSLPSPDNRTPYRASSAARNTKTPRLMPEATVRRHHTDELGQRATSVQPSGSAKAPTVGTWRGNSAAPIDTQPVAGVVRTPSLARAQSPPVPQPASLTPAHWPSESAAATMHRCNGRVLRQCCSARTSRRPQARVQTAHRPARSTGRLVRWPVPPYPRIEFGS
ncbi:hypothetical protein GCM10009730_62010 [Streptomyces albidochromogenes]